MNAYFSSENRAPLRAVIVVSCLLLCAAVPMVSFYCSESDADDGAKPYSYVSVGDSMVCGYGMTGYFNFDKYPTYMHNGFLDDVEGTYAQMFEQYLKGVKGADNVTHTSMSAEAFDYTLINYLLNIIPDDSKTLVDDEVYDVLYGSNRLKMYQDGLYDNGYITEKSDDNAVRALNLSNFAKETLSKADLVTFESHFEISYEMNKVVAAILYGEDPGIDFTPYLSPTMIALYERIMEDLMALLEVLVPGITDEQTFQTFLTLAEGLTYCVIKYCSNLDGILSWMAANSSARVVVVDTFNVIDKLTITVGNLVVPAGEIVNLLFSYCNFYTEYLSPYALNVRTVDIDSTPEYFGDQFTYADATGSNITVDSKNTMAYFVFGNGESLKKVSEELAQCMQTPWGIPANGHIVYDYFDVTSGYCFTAFMKKVFNTTNVNLEDVLGGIDAGKIQEKTALAFQLFGAGECKLVENADGCTIYSTTVEAQVSFTNLELFAMWMNMFFQQAWGVLAHTDEVGHGQIYDMLVETVNEEELLYDEPKGSTLAKIIINGAAQVYAGTQEWTLFITAAVLDIVTAIVKAVGSLTDLLDTMLEQILLWIKVIVGGKVYE